MGKEEAIRIKAFFSEMGITPVYLEHKAVTTSADAAKTRGFALRQGIKAILLTNTGGNGKSSNSSNNSGSNGNGGWVIVDVPADKKVDIKQVADHLGWSKGKIRLATAEEVLQKTGCEVGAVPPFGHRELLLILVDGEIYLNQESAFNIGLRTQSAIVKTESMKKVFEKIQAIEGTFSR